MTDSKQEKLINAIFGPKKILTSKEIQNCIFDLMDTAQEELDIEDSVSEKTKKEIVDYSERFLELTGNLPIRGRSF